MRSEPDLSTGHPTEIFEEHRSTLDRGGVPDPGQPGGGRGRRTGGLDPLVGRRPRRDRPAARLPAHDHHPAGAQPVAHARHAAGELRRALAARARRERSGPQCRWCCGRPAGRRGVHGDADRAGVAEPAGARRVRAHRGVRHGRTGGRRGARPEPGGGAPAGPSGPVARGGEATAAGRGPAAAPRDHRTVHGRCPRR